MKLAVLVIAPILALFGIWAIGAYWHLLESREDQEAYEKRLRETAKETGV